MQPVPASERVVVVDDDAEWLSLTADILRRHGYAVTAFTSGPDALRALDGGEPVDLLLTDVHLPVLSGPALAAEVVARRPGVAVLFMSGSGPDGDDLPVERAAMVRKPCTHAALVDAVIAALPAVHRSGPAPG